MRRSPPGIYVEMATAGERFRAFVPAALLERGDLRIDEFEALVPGVHRRTLQRDLKGLVDRGIAAAKGAARSIRYHLRGKGL